MAYNPRFPIGATPQDPLRRRRPLPSDYPYEPEVLEAPEELPNLPVREFQAPAIPLTPGLNRPQGPGTLTPAPFRTLGQFNQWYTGQPTDILPGDVLPPSPEWGKRTPSYSRLNPPPSRQAAQPTPAPSPTAPATPPAPSVSSPFGQLPSEQFQQRLQGLGMGPQIGAMPPAVQPSRAGMLGGMGAVQPAPARSLRDFRVPTAELRLPQAIPAGPLQSGLQAKAQLTAPMQGRALTRPEQQMRTEAMLSGMGTEARVSAPTPAEQRAQAAAERAQIAGSVGGQTAWALLTTPFDTPETRQKVAQTGGQFLNRVARSFGSTLANVPMGIGASTPLAAQAVEQDMAPVQAWLKRTFPTDAEQKDFVNAVLPETAGSLGAFMLGSLAGGGSTMSAAMMGALVNAGSTYDEVRQRGFSRENAIKAARFGRLIGAGEAFGVGRMIDKIAAARPMLGRALNVGEEGVQELISGWLNNANAKYASGYDPERALTEGLDEQLMGGLAGGALVETLGAGLAGLLASRKGGVNKVPDELQKQLYDNMVQAGMPRAPLSYVPGVPSQRQEPESEMTGAIPPDRAQAYRELREKQRAAGVSPFGGQRPAGEAVPPVQPLPLALNGGAQAAPFTPSGTLFTPGWSLRPLDEQFQERTSRGVLYGLVGPEQRAISEAAMEAASAEGQPATLRDVTSTATNKNRYGQGEYGKIAQSANKAPSFSFEKLKKAYGLPEDANRLELFEPIMQNLAAELGDVIGRDISINDVHRLAYIIDESKSPADEQNVWGKWYEKYGRAYGLSEQDVWNLQDIAAGGGRGSFFDDYAVQQTLLGEPTSKGQNKDIQKIVREDMAKLLGYDVNDPRMKEFSQASMSPDMWRLWARSRGFGDQKRYPGVMQKLEMMIEEGELRKTAKKTDKADDMAIIPRKGQWPGTTPTTGATPPSPPSPVAPTAPTAPPAPQRPVAPTTAPTTGATSPAPSVPSGGRVVNFQDEDITLTPEQAKAWDDADKSYNLAKQRLDNARKQGNVTEIVNAERDFHGAGQRLAAERRRITNRLTPKEQAARPKFASETRVWVNGQEGKVWQPVFGKYKVRLLDGTMIMVPAESISAEPPVPLTPSAPSTPVPPSTAPTRYQPSSLKRQYSEMVQEGVPRAPRSYVPGVPLQRQGPGYQMTGKGRGFRYTTTAQPQGPMPPGPLMVVDREREEREQAGQPLERLRKKSPFARGRQAERERAEAAMKGRRPAPPPAEPSPVTPPPKPPVAPPAPSGAAQPTPPVAPPTQKAAAQPTQPATPTAKPSLRQRIIDAGWEQDDLQRFTGPDGSTIEREDGSRGRRQGWVHTDAVGNRTNYNTAQEAIEAVLAEPSTAVQPEVKAQPKAGRAKAQPEAKPTPPPSAEPKQRKPKAAKEATPAPVVPTPTETIPTPMVEPVADVPEVEELFDLEQDELRNRLKSMSPEQLLAFTAKVQQYLQVNNITSTALSNLLTTLRGTTTQKSTSKSQDTQSEISKLRATSTKQRPKPPAPAPEAAPKATKTGKATTAQPVSAEDKAMLEDIDKNGKKTKQRKRIETEYGEKGKKAIFVENNINEILKEAEESGKVTKQCP